MTKHLVTARDARRSDGNANLTRNNYELHLQTKSFISAASFQETTKVLNEAAVSW
jgi:DNA-directed RNA polymerase subunit beta'